MQSVLVSFLLTLRTAARSRAELQLEVLALRHQVQVLQRTRPRRVRLAKADRWLWVVLSRIWSGYRLSLGAGAVGLSNRINARAEGGRRSRCGNGAAQACATTSNVPASSATCLRQWRRLSGSSSAKLSSSST